LTRISETSISIEPSGDLRVSRDPAEVGRHGESRLPQKSPTMKLTEDVVASIRRYKRVNQKATYREMGEVFDLSIPSIMRALGADGGYARKPVMVAQKPAQIGPTPQPAGSCIRPIPLSRLMAGR
jgi:hypothetical protein